MRDNHGRKASIYQVLAFVLAAILLWVLIPGPDLQAAPSLAEIQKDLKEVRAKQSQLADKKTKLTGELAYLEKRSEAQRAVYEDALQQKEVALMLLEMNQEAAEIALADYQEKLGQYEERVARMYAWNRLSLTELLLSSRSLQGFFTTLRFMKMVAESDEQALADLEEASILARQLEEEADDQYTEMIDLVKEAEVAMQAIRDQEHQTAAELKQVSSSLEISRQKEAQLARDAQQSSGTPSTPRPSANSSWVGTGPFIWPLPDASYVTSVFGWRAKYGRYHYGTDVAAPTGTRIVAMADGVVTYAGWPGTAYHWAYGIMIVIDHGNGLQTRYGHLSRVNCHIGQRVKAGDVVGFTGNTGRSSGPHLHFETRVNGVPKDPLGYFRRR
ncbi:MAG TPA: peptidoglycan DD-metalloendopeptidase family protein [Clostridia bacterium]|nr:peptidoglycan DD-metalloendopeptidase family protein [Clostridia bacterium]